MKFIHVAGDYATKDGVTFFFKNPTEVENKSTIEKLLKDPDYITHESWMNAFVGAEEKLDPKPAPLAAHIIGAKKTLDGPENSEAIQDACPKCGRVVKQGKYMHQKFCKGPK
jgi:hypothetical protein